MNQAIEVWTEFLVEPYIQQYSKARPRPAARVYGVGFDRVLGFGSRDSGTSDVNLSA